jgi:hypothetical protein
MTFMYVESYAMNSFMSGSFSSVYSLLRFTFQKFIMEMSNVYKRQESPMNSNVFTTSSPVNSQVLCSTEHLRAISLCSPQITG